MNILSSKDTQIEDLFNRVGDKLQLNKTRREKIDQSYKTISGIFDNDDGLFRGAPVLIYPQGSYRIGTTVKPILKMSLTLTLSYSQVLYGTRILML